MGYFNNGIGAARINDSSPSDYTTYSGNKIETKQNATDNTLTTTSKTIVGAINEVNSKVNNKFIVAQTLPVSDIDEFAIYLIPKSTAQTNNIYDEYVYISTDIPAHWERIGDTEIDLSGYYTSSQVDTLLSDKQDATDNNLDTVDKTIIGAINENKSVIGYSYDAYDATTAYSTGDLCIYNNVLYKARQATTGNLPTNTTYWDATSIADEIGRIDTALSVVGHNIAEEYDPTHTYSLGDLVVYENQFYKSNAENITGAWDSTKWNEVTVASELTNIVVKRTLTETTSGNGNVVNYINVANGIIVSAICTSQEAIVIPFQNSQGTLYSFHVMSPISAHGVVANTSVTIDFYMIPNRRIV